jgi:hypothetical protein
MNNKKQFLDFCLKKRLTATKKTYLKNSRNTIRDRIKKKFSDDGKKQPSFCGQGSYVMKTTINPLNGEYDIDDGVYLNNIDTSKDVREWEKTETVHSWIYNAIENHTNKTEDKPRCVRVIYSKDYHVDLPIYVIKNNECYLAEKGEKQWNKSDPKAINDWFKNRDSEEKKKLERIIIYLKAWKDFREFNNQSLKLVGGLQLTVLAEKYFILSDCDEESLFKTVEKINNNLHLHPPLNNPIDNSLDLFFSYSSIRVDKFKEEFDSFYKKAKDAYYEEDNLESAKLWKKIFGDDFPLPKIEASCSEKSFNSFRISQSSLEYSENEEYIEDICSVNLNPIYNLEIGCEVEQNGFRKKCLKYIPLLKPQKKLRFFCEKINVPKPYIIKWKVKNHGENARQLGALRGEITDDYGNMEKIEHTKYKGEHYVECYVIKNGICVARDKIEVPIDY